MADRKSGPRNTPQGDKQNVTTPLPSKDDVVELVGLNNIFPTIRDWEFIDGTKIDGTRWNKSFPYQLLVLDGRTLKTVRTFTLPIPPQEMAISTPFAITTSLTMGGVVEEHNGAPMRMINFSGVTGVAPNRGVTEPNKAPLSTILGGSVRAAQVAGAAGANLSATLSGTPKPVVNLMEETDENLKLTGYYQFRLLQQFLEQYAQDKKDRTFSNLRLALAIWKDASVYLVSPLSFDVRRSSGTPWLYNYSLSLKAWRRVSLTPEPSKNHDAQPIQSSEDLAKILAGVQEARTLLNRSKDTMLAASADVREVVLEPLRTAALFCGDAIGFTVTMADLPGNIARLIKKAVTEATGITSIVGNGGAELDQTFRRSLEEWATINGRPETKASDPQDQLGTSRQTIDNTADPANKVFDNPEDNYESMTAVKPGDLNLPPTVFKAIQDERERVRKLTRLDFEIMRDNMLEFQATFGDTIGAGSEVYDDIFNRTPATPKKSPSLADYDTVFALNNAITELSKLAGSGHINPVTVTTMEVVAGMASSSGIAFTVPASKFPVPFPYGSTLEQLSLQYLSTPDRWHEIATLNGLRAPYVDEVGFELPLLTCGKGNQVVVGDGSKLTIGQIVYIRSSTAPKTTRRIINIDRTNPNGVVVYVDGEPNMEIYDVQAQAVLQSFLPDTVNGQMMIYIPSEEPTSEEDWRTKSIPGVNEYDQIIAAGGVDLLLTQDGDLAITPDGDCKLAIGVANIVQRIRTAVATPRGSLLHHPDYGSGVQPGVSTADVDAKTVKGQLEGMLRDDPSFGEVRNVTVQKNGPVARITVEVSIPGSTQIIPVSVDIRR